MSADFLVEIGTEELPPKALLSLSEAFRDAIVNQLVDADLSFGEIATYAAPRRLAVLVHGLDEATPERATVAWGAPTRIAFDAEGNPGPAAKKFADKNGLPLEQITNYVENDGKEDKLCVRETLAGKPIDLPVSPTEEPLLGRIVREALKSLPIPKRMRWGANREEFVRPVHWVVMLLGDKVVDANIMGQQTSNSSRGHRFHSTGEIIISTPAGYRDALRGAYVIADFAERREMIRHGVTEVAQIAGGNAIIEDDLLDEVTSLNEWPVPLLGHFEQRFLEVPAEALISSMKEHQKYFHVQDSHGELMPLFVTVANIESRDPDQVTRGNERVIRPRLADAAFFYETDLSTTLAERRESLKSIVFQAQLGSIYEKTERVAKLAEILAPVIGADPASAKRAAELSKSDLVSEMVGEFDKLQGVMGRYYALHDGEDTEVAEALYEQYLPKFAGDEIPKTTSGATLALADRLDTLVGIFGIGQKPTGSRDPFALRRASLGVLRIVVERGIDFDLRAALSSAIEQHRQLTVQDNLCEQVLTYMLDRFRAWYEDENIATEVFLSVAAKKLSRPLDIHQRVHAVNSFSQLPEATALAAANKRVSNILGGVENTAAAVDLDRLTAKAEMTLASELARLEKEVRPKLQARDYSGTLTMLASLRDPVDAFFDDVMVMVDDEALRANRLALLKQLRNLFLEVADISQLVPNK